MMRSAWMLKLRTVAIFFREVGKVVAAFWVTFAIGAAIAHYFEWSIGTVAGLAIFVLGTIFSAIAGWREFQTEARLDRMRYLGQVAASVGRPPDFYKNDGIDADVADEIAIMQGWDLGWKEFQALPKNDQAFYAALNRRDGYGGPS